MSSAAGGLAQEDATDPHTATDPNRPYFAIGDQLVGAAACDPQDLRHLGHLQPLIVLLVHVTLLRSFAAIRMLRCLGTLAYRNRQGLPIPGEVEVEAMPSLASVTNVHREGHCTSDSSRFVTIRSSPTSRHSKLEVWHGCSPRVQGHRRLLSAAHEVV